jgi:ribosomal protein L37E
MEPTRDTQASLVDLLDRILDKGLMLNTDLIISVAGIPLLGVNLRAALAGMDTMLKYGVMKDWDEAQRAIAREERRKRGNGRLPLVEGEEVILKMFASHYYSKGIYRNWRPGHLYITDRRLFLFRKEPPEVLFEVPYEGIRGMAVEEKKNIARKETHYLYLLLNSGEVAQLHPPDASVVKDAIGERMKAMGLELEENPSLPLTDERAVKFLCEGEELTHSGKMWHLMTLPAPGITSDTWKPGHLYLASHRLLWWYDFDERIAFETPSDKIIHATVEVRDLGSMVKQQRVLDVLYKNGQGNKVACFSGSEEEIRQWEQTLREVIAQHNATNLEDDTEECPQCGKRAPVEKLLKQGCSHCGWLSPKLKRKEAIL